MDKEMRYCQMCGDKLDDDDDDNTLCEECHQRGWEER